MLIKSLVETILNKINGYNKPYHTFRYDKPC